MILNPALSCQCLSNLSAIFGQAPKASLQVIPAGEPESRAKTILFLLCLILWVSFK
jgi:hypothetical protein